MSDLNVALILRLVDKATAPAKNALRTIERSGAGMRSFGAAQVKLSKEQIMASQAHTQALVGEAAALAGTGFAMVKLIKPAVDFEASMAKVGAVSRASDKDLDRLTATARTLGRETPWSASQAAEGMQYLAMAGFDVNQTIEAMPGMLNLASAGAIDLGSAADIASNILTGFNMEAGQTNHLGDVMVNTFTSSNTTLSSLGETMKYVAPAAASLGLDLETTAAMAGKLGDAGIQGSEAGTALRAVLLQLSGATPQAQKVLQKLGVSVKDASGNMRAVPEILADLDEAMRGFGTAQRAEMTKTIFGTEAMSAATVLMAQAGTGSLQKYAESLHETGSAARVAAKINDNTAGALKTLASRAEALSIALGSKVLPMIVEFIDYMVPLLDRLTEWADANPEIIRGLALAAAALFGMRVALLSMRIVMQPLIMAYWVLNGVLGGLIWTFGAAIKVFSITRSALMLLGGVARGAAALGLRVLGGAIRFVGRSLLWAGRVALANPIIAVLTLIAVAAYAIYENWDGFVAYFQDKVDRVRAAFDTGLLNGVWALLSEFNPFAMAFDGAIALAKFIWEKLVGAFDIDLFDKGAEMITSLKDGIWSVLTGMVEGIKAKLQSIVPDWMIDAWNWVKGDDPAPSPGGGAAQGEYGKRATGGPVRAGMIYRWLEEGQEMFTPAVDGHVISSRQLRGMRQGGGRSLSLNLGGVVIHAAPGQSPTDIARAVRSEVERLMSESGALHDGGEYAY